MIKVVLVYFSAAVMNTMTKSDLGEAKVISSHTSKSQPTMEGI